MKINGYELNYSQDEIKKMATEDVVVFKMIDKSFSGYESLQDGDKKALQHLANAAKYFDTIALEQDNPQNLEMKKGLETASKTSDYIKDTLTIFDSMLGVEGTNGIDKDPIKLFKGLSTSEGHNFYPVDMDVAEFHHIIKTMMERGKSNEVKKILSNRTIVRRDGDELKAVDYVEYFAKEFYEITSELKAAAENVTNHQFKKYLELQIPALLIPDENLDAQADTVWAEMQDTNLEMTIGRESYDDGLTPTILENYDLKVMLEEHQIPIQSKDLLGMRVGIVNKQGTEVILKFKELLPDLAKKMPHSDQYTQSISDDLKQTMVDVDLVDLRGDYAQLRGGITTAQNLPNNDKLSVIQGAGRRNVYHRQVREYSDKRNTYKLMDKFLDPDLIKYYNPEADHLFVVGHENAHSLGPDTTYQSALGLYKHVIEELKADIASLALMPEYVKSGVIDDKTLKSIYVSQIADRCMLKAEPQMATPHRIAELIIFNYIMDDQAVYLNDDNKLTINFSIIEGSMYNLLSETIDLQLSRSPQKAKDFIDRHATWTKLSKEIAEYNQSLGLKPYKQIKRFF